MKTISRKELGQQSHPGVMVLPTDTVYGLHACIDDMQAIEILKYIKERHNERYFITLISSWEQIIQCGIVVSDKHRMLLERIWPGPYTVLLRDNDGASHSFRWPHKSDLLELIDYLGPLYSTSANWHGEPTICTLDALDAKISHLVDYAIDGGELSGQSSTIIDLVR